MTLRDTVTEDFVDGDIDRSVIRAADREYASVIEQDFGQTFESLAADITVMGRVAA